MDVLRHNVTNRLSGYPPTWGTLHAYRDAGLHDLLSWTVFRPHFLMHDSQACRLVPSIFFIGSYCAPSPLQRTTFRAPDTVLSYRHRTSATSEVVVCCSVMSTSLSWGGTSRSLEDGLREQDRPLIMILTSILSSLRMTFAYDLRIYHSKLSGPNPDFVHSPSQIYTWLRPTRVHRA